MRRRFLTLWISAFVACGTALSPLTMRAQEMKENQAKSPAFYRVDYAVHELEHGKRTNTRNYILKAEGEERPANFRIGSRIPVATGNSRGLPATAASQFQYLDVGVNLECRLKELDGYIRIHTKLELNSVADAASPPVLRHFQFDDTTPAVPGKATLVGAIDDVTANRRYEVEVTVEKIK